MGRWSVLPWKKVLNHSGKHLGGVWSFNPVNHLTSVWLISALWMWLTEYTCVVHVTKGTHCRIFVKRMDMKSPTFLHKNYNMISYRNHLSLMFLKTEDAVRSLLWIFPENRWCGATRKDLCWPLSLFVWPASVWDCKYFLSLFCSCTPVHRNINRSKTHQ